MSTTSYSVSVIAKLFDLTERRVQQLAAEGVIPKASKGKYELVPSVKGYIRYLKERSIGKDMGPSSPSTERARLIKIQADKLEMEISKANQNLLPRKLVIGLLTNIVIRCKSVLLTMPSKLAPQMIGLSEPKEAEIPIKEAVDEALAELSVNDIFIDINIVADKPQIEEVNDDYK